MRPLPPTAPQPLPPLAPPPPFGGRGVGWGGGEGGGGTLPGNNRKPKELIGKHRKPYFLIVVNMNPTGLPELS